MEERRWHRWYADRVPPSIDYPDLPVHGLLERAARDRPDTTALVFYGRETTYAELADKVDGFAAGLQSLGVEPGDRVAVMLPTSPQFVVAFLGALKAGAVAVPTNPLYTQRELVHQWDDASVSVGVTLDIFFDRAADVDRKLDLDVLVVGDIADELPTVKSLLYPLKRLADHGRVDVPWGAERVHRFADVESTRGEPATPGIDPVDDLAALQYTGGTTGLPKGAMLTHRNLVSNAVANSTWLNVDEDEQGTNLSVLPFFHVYGLTVAMLATIVRRSTQVLHPDARDIDAIVDLIDEHEPEYFESVPALFVAINEHPRVDEVELSCLEGCFSGSAPLPLEVMREFEKRSGADVVEGYGLTEASPVTHANPVGGEVRPGTIGVPFPDTDAKVVDPETGDQVPPGEPGELIVKGPQVMKGYWDAPEETEQTLRDGWLHTGDIATVDEDGYFTIVDRKKDVIIASGFNVYPREVEEVLYELDEVEECAVFGVPHDKRGETVAATIVVRDGASLGADEVEARCRANLADYKVPKVVRFMDELPKSAVQKTLKRELRDMVEVEG